MSAIMVRNVIIALTGLAARLSVRAAASNLRAALFDR
jgi:hypothetical protein